MIAAARARLQAATADRVAADAALEEASHAAGVARIFAAGVQGEVDRYIAADRLVSSRRSRELKEAIRRGDPTPRLVEVPELPRAAAARADAESRLAAAQEAVADLEADEREAKGAAEAAAAEAAAAVKGVIAAEGDDLARRIMDLESEAFQLRQRLGCEGGYLDQARAPLTLQTIAVIRENGSTAIMAPNTAPWRASNAASAAWQMFRAALERDPAAELTFQNPAANAAKAAKPATGPS